MSASQVKRTSSAPPVLRTKSFRTPSNASTVVSKEDFESALDDLFEEVIREEMGFSPEQHVPKSMYKTVEEREKAEKAANTIQKHYKKTKKSRKSKKGGKRKNKSRCVSRKKNKCKTTHCKWVKSKKTSHCRARKNLTKKRQRRKLKKIHFKTKTKTTRKSKTKKGGERKSIDFSQINYDEWADNELGNDFGGVFNYGEGRTGVHIPKNKKAKKSYVKHGKDEEGEFVSMGGKRS